LGRRTALKAKFSLVRFSVRLNSFVLNIMIITRKPVKKILVFFATYNELDNIEFLLNGIFDHLPGQEVLVVDDDSPDGTGKKLDILSKNNKHITVIHRPRKLGLGTAHKLAMQYSIKKKFDILITMDADFSHHPDYLPTMVELMNDNDFVIGSRYVKGGGLGYGILRRSISITANILTRNMLKIPLKECTTSYRGFQVSLLKKVNLNLIRSEGYSFFIESIFIIQKLTKNVTEFPIFFYDRQSGRSKISKIEIVKSIFCLVRLFYKRIIEDKSHHVAYKITSPNIPCPNCSSPYLSRVLNEVIFNKKNQIKGHPYENYQCLQCGEYF